MIVGLRVDVDTLRGTRRGVPALVGMLERHRVRASFFFSVGPDNMGRHLWRLFKPDFLRKMLRTDAADLYGWDILLRGTLWPGPRIGRRCGAEIREAAERGHEVGLHAWDHHAWQAHLDRWDEGAVRAVLQRGFDGLSEVAGRAPTCSATPGWRCNDLVLRAKTGFPFVYNSDCRGTDVFVPVVDGSALSQPQIPVTLPTYDEVVGREGVTDESYNDHLLGRLASDALNVLAVHAEVEGLGRARMFDDFLARAIALGVRLVPLADLLESERAPGEGRVTERVLPGREGLVACQTP